MCVCLCVHKCAFACVKTVNKVGPGLTYPQCACTCVCVCVLVLCVKALTRTTTRSAPSCLSLSIWAPSTRVRRPRTQCFLSVRRPPVCTCSAPELLRQLMLLRLPLFVHFHSPYELRSSQEKEKKPLRSLVTEKHIAAVPLTRNCLFSGSVSVCGLTVYTVCGATSAPKYQRLQLPAHTCGD